MADYSVTISDTITTTEKIDVLANSTRKITVLDNTAILENVDILRAGARNITVTDTVFIIESFDIIRANARTVNVLDASSTIEGVGFTIIQSPANINRTISLIFIIPATLPFIVTKKDATIP